MRPRLIVIEGLDGTGKTTLARALAESIDAALLRTPPVDLAGVRAEVDRAMAESPVGAQLFYASTVALASQRARAIFASGRDVVIDRYWSSTVAYAECRAEHVDLSAVGATVLPADLTIYLEVDESVRRQRLAARGCTDADLDSIARRDALREAYERALLGPWSGRTVRLDVTRLSPAECLAHAREALAMSASTEAA